MAPADRALTAPRALVPAGERPADALGEARARLDAALAEVTALDAEVEALSAALAAFAAALEARLGAPDAEARRAAGLVRRLQALADGLVAEVERVKGLAGGTRRRRARKARGRHADHRLDRDRDRDLDPDLDLDRDADPDPDPDPDPDRDPDRDPEPAAADDEVPTPQSQAAALKRLYRRLARLLHPDLARTEAEQARLSSLMAGVNAAYAAGDLPALELLAEKVGAGEPPEGITDAERLAHLARRTEQLLRVAASLRRERERLARSQTARLHAEAAARAEAGGDWLAEGAAALAEEAREARADALARLAALPALCRALSRARKAIMDEQARKGGVLSRRPFDPLAESPLVRRSAERLERARAGAPARELARWLEAAAARAPWEAGLTLLAFLAEAAGARPPPSLGGPEGWAPVWERLRGGWPGAPDLAGALSRLPRHLVLGARAGRGEVLAGLQLADAGLAAGVRLALGHRGVAAVAREVLAALGPEARCEACRREVVARHLLRTRGLDEVNGLACPRCGAVLRSYWRYGEPEGLEALAPLAVEVGLTAEVPVRLGGTTLAFQLLPEEAAALTAAGLVARFEALYLAHCKVALPEGALWLAAGGKRLAPGAAVAGAGTLTLRLDAAAGTTSEGLVELLRARVERRFRPGGQEA